MFKEKIPKRLWTAIALVTLSSIVLTMEDAGSLDFSAGSLLVLLACICWGFKNNCTRMLSKKDSLEIVVTKGFGSGTGAMAIALAVGERLPDLKHVVCVLLLGLASYGLSIFFYICAQRELGAAKTSACYAVSPFHRNGAVPDCFSAASDGFLHGSFAFYGVGVYFASTDPGAEETA